ncbi:VOC family protein [Pendulispora albinea]|uniref:VOC family protein n=1 Tax=Pendulispora albinea TaxID=2741071 RepID=A0ABZ2M2A9_9BACT
MILNPLDHLAIHVADRQAAEKTVSELLGHTRVQEMRLPCNEGTAHLSVMMEHGDRFHLVLCEGDGPSHPITQWVETRGPGVHHLAHRVDLLEQSLQNVVQGGGESVGSIVEADGLKQVFTTVSEDGILHEITQRAEKRRFVEGNTAKLIAIGASVDPVK